MVLDGVTAEEQETLVSVAQKMMHNIALRRRIWF